MFGDLSSGTVELLTFDSYAEQVDELMKLCSSIKTQPNGQRKWLPGHPRFDVDYVGRKFDNWQQVKQAAESTWPHGLEVLDNMKRLVADARLPRPQNLRRQVRYSEDTGDEVCLDRLRRQVPFWRTTARDHRPGPMNVTILADLGAAFWQKPDNLLWRGAAALIVTQMLEEAGYRVELWNYHCDYDAYKDGRHLCIATCLKRCSDSIDESTLVNAISGWSYRSITFGSHWHCGEAHDEYIGKVAQISPWLVSQITPDVNAVLCKELWNLESSVKWIRDTLKTFDPQGRN